MSEDDASEDWIDETFAPTSPIRRVVALATALLMTGFTGWGAVQIWRKVERELQGAALAAADRQLEELMERVEVIGSERLGDALRDAGATREELVAQILRDLQVDPAFDTEDPWGNELRIFSHESFRFPFPQMLYLELQSSGPDGLWETEDDLFDGANVSAGR